MKTPITESTKVDECEQHLSEKIQNKVFQWLADNDYLTDNVDVLKHEFNQSVKNTLHSLIPHKEEVSISREELLLKLAFARFEDWTVDTPLSEHHEMSIIFIVCEVIGNPSLALYTDLPKKENVYKRVYNVLIELKIIKPLVLPEGFPLFQLLIDKPQS